MDGVSLLDELLVFEIVIAENPIPGFVVMIGHVAVDAVVVDETVATGVETGLIGELFVVVEVFGVAFWFEDKAVVPYFIRQVPPVSGFRVGFMLVVQIGLVFRSEDAC